MAMQPESTAVSGMPTSPSGMCPDCKGMDHSKAIAPDCAIGVCAGLIAILPAALGIDATPLSVFQIVAQRQGRGITIPPPLGPPRLLHLA